MVATTRSRTKKPSTSRRSTLAKTASSSGKSPKSPGSPPKSVTKKNGNNNSPVVLFKEWLKNELETSKLQSRSATRKSPSQHKKSTAEATPSPRSTRHGSSPRQSTRSRATAKPTNSPSFEESDSEPSPINDYGDEESEEEESEIATEDDEEVTSEESDEEVTSEESDEEASPGKSMGGKRRLDKLKATPRKKKTKAGYERRARGICEEDQELIRKMIKENQEPAVILNAASYDPMNRRRRVTWTPAEVMYLRMGVDRFGLAWSEILGCPDYKFQPSRKSIDLKDKWRNVTAYRTYSSHGKRTFILLDENHQPIIRSDSGKPFRFVNRWPRDAALKAASRTEFYEPGRETTTIYVREVGNEHDRETGIPPLVHVYEGTRRKEPAPPHLSEINIRTVWSSDVRKVREERFVSKEDFRLIESRV